MEQTNSLTDQCLSCDTGLVQINLQIQGPQKRINILDVLKPTEEEIAKYYKQLSSELDSSNDDALNGSADRSSNKFTIKSESSRTNEDFDNDREELNNSLKRNQKPSELLR